MAVFLTIGIIVVALVAGRVIAAICGRATSAQDDNDLTGSNANFGKSLMGDNDNFGKGL